MFTEVSLRLITRDLDGLTIKVEGKSMLNYVQY